jgi:carbamoyltransferase
VSTVLGLSAYYHDSSAALLSNGSIIAAAQEERFTRKKHDASYPYHAIEYCLKEAGIRLSAVDHIVFYEKPFLKFERLLETYTAFAPKGLLSFQKAIPIWLREKLFQKNMLLTEFKKNDPDYKDEGRLKFSEHHLSHAASAFYPSPFEEAAVLTLDGVGEWATTTVALGYKNELEIKKEIHFPHSLGLLYSAVTYYIGFRVNSGEYKVMGLAPYGSPKYKDKILENLIELKNDGSFWLDQSYFNYCTGLTMVNSNFAELFGQPIREPDKQPLTQFHMDMASSIQAVIEEAVLKLATHVRRTYDTKNLCLAGGVALNCVANGKLLKSNIFDQIWVQPAAGDSGGALGAALALWHKELKNFRQITAGKDTMCGSYLGPQYSRVEIEQRLTDAGAIFTHSDESQLIETIAQALADGKVVGWFNGRMEFGPRSLGARSILGDPRSPSMQKDLNLKIKYRESFRPFAPSVLAEHVSNWFDLDTASPYMLLVANVKADKIKAMKQAEAALFGIDKLNAVRSDIPAVTHVDYTARIQTVHENTNPRYYALINKFYELTGCPVLVNTSFNVRGEPIVCTPEDAFRCFLSTKMDVLVCGNSILLKKEQDLSLAEDYKNKYELD